MVEAERVLRRILAKAYTAVNGPLMVILKRVNYQSESCMGCLLW